LQDYVKHTNLAYIYSFVQDDNGDIHFTSSSMTENEIEQDSAAIASFEVYEDADVKEVFETNKTLFVEGVDQWGHFRSVLIPVQAPDGSRYVIGADYKIKDINTLKANKKYQVLWVFIPLVLMTLIYFLLIMINIKHAQQIILEKTLELRKIYETDKLTKLPNREKLLHRLSKHSDSLLAIVDINNFKILNEIYGVEIADKFLIFIAKELEKILSYKMELFKLDHDLFCIVSSNADLIFFKDYILQILEQLEKKEFIESNYSIHVTYTAGISHVTNMLNPMLAAEYALQNAKNKGEKVLCYIGSSEEFNSTTHKREVLDNINYAIKNNKIFPYFQPIYNTKTKTITKYEGLVRLETMDGKIMPPAYFLKTAIDTGLYKHISRIMLDKVVNTALKHPDFIFSINISALDIESEYIRSNILKTITKHKLQDRIILEVLESEEFKNFGALINFAQNANEQRIKLSLDDFGSGYS
ncbi:MAG: EAL domain-containing protein, partial [Campylobacterales bacterium]|nr:EAL domain-containing protein [Campylobacterales bacterium]